MDGRQIQLPFSLLTNGGGIPESERATLINNIVYEKEPGDRPLITKDNIIMCHTPFSDPSMLSQFQDEFVLVSGLGRMIDVASVTYGYNKVIDIEELFAIYPESCPGLP